MLLARALRLAGKLRPAPLGRAAEIVTTRLAQEHGVPIAAVLRSGEKSADVGIELAWLVFL